MDNVLERLIEEIEAAEKDRDIDIDSVDWKVRPGMQMRKRQGEESVPKLKAKYREAVRPRSIGIFVDGPSAERFAQIAKDSDVLSVNADQIYRLLAREVWQAMNEKPGTFTANESAALLTAVRHLSIDLGLTSIAVVRAEGINHIDSEEHLVSFLRNVIRNSENGDGLSRIAMEHAAGEAALAIRYTSPVVPVVVLHATNEERTAFEKNKDLFGGTVFSITTTDDISEEWVTNALAKISKELKKLKNSK